MLTIITLLISATTLLVGPNIIGRLISKEDNKEFNDAPKLQSQKEITTQPIPKIEIDKADLNTEKNEEYSIHQNEDDLISENEPQLSNEEIAEIFLDDKYSPKFEEFIKTKNFDKALRILEIATSKITKSDSYAVKVIENRKKSILLIMEKGFDNVWFGFPSKLILTEKNGKQGLYSRDGKEVIPPKYDEIDPTAPFDNLLVTELDNKTGFIDEYGNIKYDAVIDNLEPFAFKPLILIYQNNKCGFLDMKGNVIKKPQFEDVWPPDESGYIMVKKEKKWGYMDTLGNEVIKIKYDTIFHFEEDYVFAKLDGNGIYLDRSGNKIKNPAFKKE